MSELPKFINEISSKCNDFIATLNRQFNKLQDLMTNLVYRIRLKYQISKHRLNNLNAFQISQTLEEMFKFSRTTEQLNSQLAVATDNLRQSFEGCFEVFEHKTLTKYTSTGGVLRKIGRELMYLQNERDTNCFISLLDENDLYHCQAIIIGPDQTPYQGGMFALDIQFPTDFPFKPPKVKFITPIYHPNINRQGSISLDILSHNWSPNLMLGQLLLSIISFLDDPNPDEPLVPEIGRLYKTDRQKYEANVREWTRRYAF